MATDKNQAALLEAVDQDSNTLQFRVSTGLKRVLGRELITDDEVAIFELVKNSFDAKAKNIYIHFGTDSITVADDGIGMSYEDLHDKWLFVAYSSKRDRSRVGKQKSYRDQVAEHQQYAGSKGIGRFSSDRLGRLLTLQTRPANDSTGLIHCLNVDWAMFEEDDAKQFGLVNIEYTNASQFDLPDGVPTLVHGSVIRINQLVKLWTRDELLKLKSGLAKLINPFGASVDGFNITMIAENEIANDKIAIEKFMRQSPEEAQENAAVVNGRVGNFIFSTLQQKTTFIAVSINRSTNTVETSLTDRGELIYRVREPNKYPLLQDAGFQCQLYYLNRAAKATFARRMSMPSVQFGSVFLFRNNFRVFPIGDDGDDWFGLDRRKQQGYARFLGTREVIGRVDVSGTDNIFQEASSRNQGLIETPAVEELRKCFREHCVKRLERYVVPVSWPKDFKDDIETLAVVETDSGRARVSAAVADIVGGAGIEVLQYSKRLVDILNERSEQFEESIANLRVVALNTGDRELVVRIEEAENRFAELKRSEAEARLVADEERQAKERAEKKASLAIAEVAEVKDQLLEERKRSLFLTSVSTLDIETLNNLHHQITIYSTNLQNEIAGLVARLSRGNLPTDHIISRLESVAFFNQKIQAVARFATKANFRLDSEHIEADLSEYIASYIREITKMFMEGNIRILVETDGSSSVRRFKPIDISIVIDNLVSNAKKARASTISFSLKQPRKGMLELDVSDDGIGISAAAANESRLFEKGFTTSDGSGLGLYHVKQVLGEMNGTIEVVETELHGAHFTLRIPT